MRLHREVLVGNGRSQTVDTRPVPRRTTASRASTTPTRRAGAPPTGGQRQGGRPLGHGRGWLASNGWVVLTQSDPNGIPELPDLESSLGNRSGALRLRSSQLAKRWVQWQIV